MLYLPVGVNNQTGGSSEYTLPESIRQKTRLIEKGLIYTTRIILLLYTVRIYITPHGHLCSHNICKNKKI
jgi:hypothetical protein